jgi:type IV secretory pathway VirB3-like protein
MAGVHHAYLGLFLVLIGFLFIWIYLPLAYVLTLIGFIIFIDDFIQHIKQKDNPQYTSFLHNLFGKYLWKYELIRKITNLFDKIFGVKNA